MPVSLKQIAENIGGMEEIASILGENPSDYKALHALGRQCLQRQNFDEAIIAFQKLVIVAPYDDNAHSALGMAFIMSGKAGEAVEHLEKAVNLNPKSYMNHANLGKVYLILNNYSASENYLKKAVSLCSNQQKINELNKLLNVVNNEKDKLFTFGIDESPCQFKAEQFSPYNLAANSLPNNIKVPKTQHMKGVLCCLNGLDNFVDKLICNLKPNVSLDKIVSNDINDHLRAIRGEDLVWLEWGNQLAQVLTNEAADILRDKRVILRIHSYEVLDRLADSINFKVVDDLVFVAPHIRDIFIERKPEVISQVKRISIIPNGVDLNELKLASKPKGFNIAFLAQLNFKKDPMVALHAFREIYKQDMRYRLYIGGNFQEERYLFGIKNFIKNNNMESSVFINGWVSNVKDWLSDKHYILCTSLMEGHPVGLLEAMAMGCCPIIYNFPGADKIYPSTYLWTELSEIWDVINSVYRPDVYRAFVSDNYSLDIQAKRTSEMIINESAIKEEQPKSRNLNVNISDKCFDKSAQERRDALLYHARQSRNNKDYYSANLFAKRAFSTSSYKSKDCLDFLIDIGLRESDMWSLKEIFYNKSIANFLNNEYDDMLKNMYSYIYAEKICRRRDQGYNYDSFVIKPEIHAFIQAAAEKLELKETLCGLLKEGESRKKIEQNGKINLGLVVETFDKRQAPIKYILNIVKKLDKERFNIILYSRYPINSNIGKAQNFKASIEEMSGYVNDIILPERGENWLKNTEEISYLIAKNNTDIALLSTSYYSTPLNLLARLRPARRIGAFEFQGPEHHDGLDFILSGTKKGLIDAPCDAYLLKQQVEITNYNSKYSRAELGIPEDAIVLTTIARNERYNSPLFWVHMQEILKSKKRLYYLPIGMDKPNCSIENVIYPGYVKDAPNMLSITDIYVDLFPSGTGLALAEAMAVGLPTVCFKPNYSSLFEWHKETFGSEWALSELSIENGDYTMWRNILNTLINNEKYRKEMGIKSKQYAKEAFDPFAASQLIENVIEEQVTKIH